MYEVTKQLQGFLSGDDEKSNAIFLRIAKPCRKGGISDFNVILYNTTILSKSCLRKSTIHIGSRFELVSSISPETIVAGALV